MKKVKRIRCNYDQLERLYSKLEHVTTDDNRVIKLINKAVQVIVRMDEEAAKIYAKRNVYDKKKVAALLKEFNKKSAAADKELHALLDEANDIHAGQSWSGDRITHWRIGSILEEGADGTSESAFVRNIRGTSARLIGLAAGVATGAALPGLVTYLLTSRIARKAM